MATADNSISLHPPPPMPVWFLSVFPQITKWHIQVILEVGLDGKTRRRKKPRRLQRRLKKRRWERWMTGDISGKRANQSLKEHLGGPKLTHTHTYTHKSCKEMDGIKRSHSEQHWIIKKSKGGGKWHRLGGWRYRCYGSNSCYRMIKSKGGVGGSQLRNYGSGVMNFVLHTCESLFSSVVCPLNYLWAVFSWCIMETLRSCRCFALKRIK